MTSSLVVRAQAESLGLRWALRDRRRLKKRERQEHEWAAISVMLDCYADGRDWPDALDVVIVDRTLWERSDRAPLSLGHYELRMEDTVPICRPKAEDSIKRLYVAMGWAAPGIVWQPSPRAAARFVHRSHEGGEPHPPATLRARARPHHVRWMVYNWIADVLRVDPVIRGRLSTNAMTVFSTDEASQVPWALARGTSLRSLIAESVLRGHGALTPQGASRFDRPMWEPLADPMCGNHDADIFAAFTDVVLREFDGDMLRAARMLGDRAEALEAVVELGANIGWYWTRERQVVACDRPNIFDFRAMPYETRLRECAPVLRWGDGFEVYADPFGWRPPPPVQGRVPFG